MTNRNRIAHEAAVAASKFAHHAVTRTIVAGSRPAERMAHHAAVCIGRFADDFLAGDPDAWDAVAFWLDVAVNAAELAERERK